MEKSLGGGTVGRGHLSSSNAGAGNGSVDTKRLAKSRGSGGDVT